MVLNIYRAVTLTALVCLNFFSFPAVYKDIVFLMFHLKRI